MSLSSLSEDGIEVDGVLYERRAELSTECGDGCKGCAGQGNISLCNALPECLSGGGAGFIFVVA